MGTLYSEIPSWMHRLPAGLKLFLLALSSVLLLALSDLRIQALAFAAIALLYASLGAASRPTRRLVVVAVIASALVGGLHAATGQPWLGLASGLRLVSTTMLGAMLTATTRFGDLLGVAEWLLSPLARLGLPVERLALQLGLMLRFAEQFFVQWQRLADAYRVRTGRSGGWRLLAPLTIHMLITARKVADALAIRLKL
ncbi:energy-coupling factor transporter transmembrane protein EcfT [Comamonas piscis]|uniref:Energy-coupling factor transporter transmembrane protein EcfT n=1 Tax=Comamonas piscis TaxID=1562974 RepID=A0A7G5EHH5_9BURK|nr:energy-coupling factor transporter transmembrane component T [Comamonas piscis]QMV73450.1 energy-coupling factor transporter transmembrane protein EcfT [Comamonas piscis]WSO31864.1 energy-coupling factor transporter transmembrane component T [Comamonas piscis]